MFDVESVPRVPTAPFPQHRTPPLLNKAHDWKNPADTCVAVCVVANSMNLIAVISFGPSPMLFV
jgi:hypothetical protein